MPRSSQGYNIAFIGLNRRAQISCAEYLKRVHGFKRFDMDAPLKKFLKTAYAYKHKQNLTFKKSLAFYDSIYRVDNEIFIKYVQWRMSISEIDTVISDVRYLNEMEALKDLGFTICRVTTPVKRLPIGEFAKYAEPGSVAMALAYDKRFSVNYDANYSVNWTTVATTGSVMDPFLERIGYKFDLSHD